MAPPTDGRAPRAARSGAAGAQACAVLGVSYKTRSYYDAACVCSSNYQRHVRANAGASAQLSSARGACRSRVAHCASRPAAWCLRGVTDACCQNAHGARTRSRRCIQGHEVASSRAHQLLQRRKSEEADESSDDTAQALLRLASHAFALRSGRRGATASSLRAALHALQCGAERPVWPGVRQATHVWRAGPTCARGHPRARCRPRACAVVAGARAPRP